MSQRHCFLAVFAALVINTASSSSGAEEIDVNSAKYRDDAARMVLPGRLPFALPAAASANGESLQIRRLCASDRRITALASDSIIRFDLTTDSAYSESFPFHIVDIECADPAHMHVLGSSWPEYRLYPITVKTDDPWSGWRRGDPVPLSDREHPLGYVTGDSDVLVLTTQRLLALQGDRLASATKLSRRIEVLALARISIVRAGADIYFGNDGGEWGGTLYRIDHATGNVSLIEPGAPVVAIVADPSHAGCVLVARSLVHIVLADGALERVCHETAQVLLDKEPVWGAAGTDPVFVGFSDGVGEVKDDAIVNRRPYPAADAAVAGLHYAGLPGVLLLSSGISQSVSVSGPAPMLVPWPSRPGTAVPQ